ncbi:MAG: efflux RND transporter periplasmic adaptor subunit [Deltaproteobacteria bacterium]|nr:efflux RND transporter periplasmic adaptor subunit [Deltaproteobacteria bacterium]
MKITSIGKKCIHHGILMLAVFIMGCSVFAVTGCGKKEEAQTGKKPVVVNIMTVKTGTAENVLHFMGDVKARRDVRLLAQVAERIVAFKADKGDFVQKGQVLAVIESTLLARGVDQAEAALEAARANLKNMKSEFGRAQRLFAEEAISHQQYDARKTQYDNTGAAVKQAEAVVEQARKQYRNAAIRAPFSGLISNRFLELGDMVAPGTPVFSLIQIDTVHVMAQVSEREFASVRIGQHARLKVASHPDRVFHGQITQKPPILDAISRLATIECSFPNPDRLLVPGMFGELEIVIDTKDDVPLVPVSAIQYRTIVGNRGANLDEQTTRQPYVFLVINGKAMRRDVVTGYQGSGLMEINSGVVPGDHVIVRGHIGLEDGVPVETVPLSQPLNRGEES